MPGTKDGANPHGGNVFAAARRYGLNPQDIVDFSANINPLGPPAAAMAALSRGIRQVIRYPEPECVELKHALSRHLGVHPGNVVVGNGGAEIIYLTMQALRPARVLAPVPTFSEYPLAARACGAEVVTLPLDRRRGFALDPASLFRLVRDRDLIAVCNPNNPTGALTSASALRRLLDETARAGAHLLVDEAFMDFIEKRDDYSILGDAAESDHLIVAGSLTKFYSIPGLRIGYAVSGPSLVERLEEQRPPWSVNSLAQVAAVASLDDGGFAARTLEFMSAERGWLAHELEGIPGVETLPPSANFILLDFRRTGITAPRLADMLGRRGVLVRDCSSFEGLDEYYVRVAVLDRESNLHLLRELRACVAVGPGLHGRRTWLRL